MIERTPDRIVNGEPGTLEEALPSLDEITELTALKSLATPPALPFAIRRADESKLLFVSVLRHLPGKRLVGEAHGSEGRVLAKLFMGDAAKRHSLREATGIQSLSEARIPTPEMITSETLPGGGYLLLTRYVAGATTLAEHIRAMQTACGQDEGRILMLSQCFRLIGQLHASGLVHRDLHPGNFLIVAGEIMLVDGDAVSGQPGARLDESDAFANLALLIVQFPMAWTLDLVPLLAEYRQSYPCLPDNLGTLEAAVRRARDKRTADYLDKASRTCSRYVAERHFTGLKIVARELQAGLRQTLADPDRAMARGDPLKQGNTATVSRIRQDGELYVVKRYNIKSPLHALSRMWRPTRAWHSWLAAHRLQLLGIATPRPLAIIERRFGPLRGRAWLVTENCPGQDLRERLDPSSPPESTIGKALVELFTVLVAARITHGDLKATNLLWHQGKIHLIDLDALTQHASITSFTKAWEKDRGRLIANWPTASRLSVWLHSNLPPA